MNIIEAIQAIAIDKTKYATRRVWKDALVDMRIVYVNGEVLERGYVLGKRKYQEKYAPSFYDYFAQDWEVVA